MVLVNVSDHLMRHRGPQIEGASSTRVLGMLFGCRSGISVHIYDSFELVHSTNESGEVVIDDDFVLKKIEHFTAIFPTYELLGWYSIGSDVVDDDLRIHRAVAVHNESPLLLMVDANIRADSKELPIKVFESVVQVVRDLPTAIFVDVDFQIETVESERITIDHIVKGGGQNSEASSLTQHLGDLHNSVEMLTKRMRLLERYVRASKSGEVPRNGDVLRDIASLCNRLPVVDAAIFQEPFDKELEDAQLLTYLAMLTKATGSLKEMEAKVHKVLDARKSPSVLRQ